VKEIEAATVLENCRALIKQIKAGLSAEKPFVNASSAAELLLHLESAAAALKKSFGPRPPEHTESTPVFLCLPRRCRRIRVLLFEPVRQAS
jgi:hypothetical protein